MCVYCCCGLILPNPPAWFAAIWLNIGLYCASSRREETRAWNRNNQLGNGRPLPWRQQDLTLTTRRILEVGVVLMRAGLATAGRSILAPAYGIGRRQNNILAPLVLLKNSFWIVTCPFIRSGRVRRPLARPATCRLCWRIGHSGRYHHESNPLTYLLTVSSDTR